MKQIAAAVLATLVGCNEAGGYCRVIDGDSLVCQDERIRLNGIDAPELTESGGRASRAALTKVVGGMGQMNIQINRHKIDRYGRSVADVKVGDSDLSCFQIKAGHARYVVEWDEGGNIMRRCGPV